MVWFHSMKEGSGLVQDQLTRLTIFIYANDRAKSRVFSSLSNPEDAAFKGTEFATTSKTDLPSSLDELYLMYLNQPISEDDRAEFLAIFGVPFMSTGKTVEELYRLNPGAFLETLEALIRSKRIQKIQNHLSSLKRCPPMPLDKGNVRGSVMRDVERLIEEYNNKYEEQEGVIAAAWLKAVEVEPYFVAKNNLYKLTATGIEGSKGGYRRKTRRNKRNQRKNRKTRK